MRSIVIMIYIAFQASACYASSTRSGEPFLIDKSKILELIFFLALIIAIIIVSSIIIKKLKLTSRFSSNVLSVVSTMPLTTKDRLVVIKTSKDNILLGLSPGRISYLCHLDPNEPFKAETAPKSTFFNALHGCIKRDSNEKNTD